MSIIFLHVSYKIKYVILLEKNVRLIVETDRLILRELCKNDLVDLAEILQDPITMKYYEHVFTDDEVLDWYNRQIDRYKNDGIGLWGVILKETGKMIGQIGLTVQLVEDTKEIEIGYLLNRRFWHKGFAIEAAAACKDYAFNVLNLTRVVSIIRDINTPSQKVAEKNGMQIEKEFTKHYYGMDMKHVLYVIEKQ